MEGQKVCKKRGENLDLSFGCNGFLGRAACFNNLSMYFKFASNIDLH